MIDTGHTIKLATKLLKEAGASRIFVLISHGLFAESKFADIINLPIERLVVTNTIPQSSRIAASKNKLSIVDVSVLLAESVRRSHNGESFNILFGELPEIVNGRADVEDDYDEELEE